MLFMVTYAGAERAYTDCFNADSLEDAYNKAAILACGSSYTLQLIPC